VRWLAVIALAGFAPLLPSPAPVSREVDNQGCVSCHSSVAAEHEKSLHAHAFSDASFQKGYRHEQKQFCRDCHMPEGSESAGVMCVTCHRPDPDGPIIGPRVSSGTHAVAATPDFGTRACVRCHDFSFPDSEPLGSKGKMQRTAEEHAGGESCATCHMPSHTFAVSRNRDLLASAVMVRASRNADGAAVFALSARGVGHAFPTGDLFRRLVLRARAGRTTLEYPFWRTFRADPAGRRFEASDNRLAPEQRVTVPLDAPVEWEVVYQRVTAVAQTPPYDVDIEAELPLVRGSLR
jgi:hypothetical protein